MRSRRRSRPYVMTRRRRIAMRMAVMRTTMNPIVIERVPSPINQTRTSPNAIHVTNPNIAIRDNIIDDTRIVFGNINVFFADRLDRHILINRHSNLVITIQIAILVGNSTHSLHGIHHISLLHIDGFAKLFCPSGILRHFTENIRERNERNHRFIIFQFGSFNSISQIVALQISMGTCKSGRTRNVLDIHRGIQHVDQQRVGVKRNRRDQRIEFRRRVTGLRICKSRKKHQ